jgi:Phage integrase, N-terminal SAM-like domain/Phage integrase family
MSSRMPALPSTRLLDQVRERERYLHYSYSTEKVYLYWIRFFIRWHGLRHPRDMGASEVEAFLSMLATERRVSSSTHNQALSALLFLYREVLGLKLPWLEGIQRPASTRRIPSVLTREEIAGVLALLEGQNALVARLLYGTGMRLMEGLRLRVKDADFERHAIVVREAKGNKDRVVMLPRSLAPALRVQMLAARELWEPTGEVNVAAWRCPTPCNPSTRKWATPGPGSGCSPRPHSLWMRAPARSAATTCTTIASSAGSSAPRCRQVWSNPCRRTRCATVSPRTCCRREPTSAPSRNCSATAT